MTLSKSYQEIMEHIQLTDEMRSRVLAGVQQKMSENSVQAEADFNNVEQDNVEPDSQNSRTNSKNEKTGLKTGKNGKGKILPFKTTRGIVSAAACLAALLLAATVMPAFLSGGSSASSSAASEDFDVTDAETADEKSVGAENSMEAAAAEDGADSIAALGPAADISEFTSAEELSDAAGFEITEWDSLPFEALEITYTWEWNEIAAITYTGDENSLTYRKAVGEDDISGDYNEYTEESVQEIDGKTVTIKGNDGTCSLAVWTADGYTYSIGLADGISMEDMEALVLLAK